MDNALVQLQIMQSVDAFFPIGAFTLSNGLEDYVLRERVTSGDDLRQYIQNFILLFPYNDLGIMALAYKNATKPEDILTLDAVAAATKGAYEIRIGSNRMCNRYIKARAAIGDCKGNLYEYSRAVKCGKAFGIHAIALGLYGADIGANLDTLLQLYGYSVLSAIVNNAVKLVPLSQLEGQCILNESMENLVLIVEEAKNVSIEDIGVSGVSYDIHCMNHERLYSRQYMS